MIFGVPLVVPLYWTVFIYTGYTLVSSFLAWINQDKPNIYNHHAILIPLLIFLDGLTVTAIDVFMDPIQVRLGGWTWLDQGPYFGVPIGNFIGWFIITSSTTTIIRVWEYFVPQTTQLPKTTLLIPVLGYLLLWFSFLTTAVKLHMIDLILIGTFAMLPIVVINLIFFVNSRKVSLDTYCRN